MKISSDFTNERGVPFCAVRIEPGEPYGNTGYCHSRGIRPPIVDEPMVEFYDRRYLGIGGCELGQFVSRYYVETLATSEHCHEAGLCLDGGIPDWQVSAENMRLVREQLYPRGV